jgi:Ferritin-like
MPEPKVVVAHREDVWWLLAEAAQLEHMIMCQYLFGEFSLKHGTDDGLTDEQAQAVDRWRQNAARDCGRGDAAACLGRQPDDGDRRGTHVRPAQLPTALGLLPVTHFLYVERPEGMERQDADGFVPVAPAREPLATDEAMPRGQEFATIGHLHRGVANGLRTLAVRLGERVVFVGSPRAQATPELFRWPQLIAVTDLASASAAVDEIIEQGEGARAATGVRRTTAVSWPCGTSTASCGRATLRSSRLDRCSPPIAGSPLTTQPRCRLSQTRGHTTWPSSPHSATSSCCRR